MRFHITTSPRTALFALSVLCLASAQAHVVLPAGGATVGSQYEAAFRVGHACKDAASTTEMIVDLPKGFQFKEAVARNGWTLTAPTGAGTSNTVRWTASSADSALKNSEKAEFIVRGVLPKTPQTLYFLVQQICDVGRADWTQIPSAQDPSAKLDSPAARLEVLAESVAPVDVRELWVRAAVAGQSGTGAFMTLQAPMGSKLVGVRTPAAGVSEIHEMKMEGDVMRMRAIPTIDLPARESVKLSPGGYHVMMMDLKQPLLAGQKIDMTLTFEDASGKRRERTETAEVRAGAAAANGHEAHGAGHQH